MTDQCLEEFQKWVESPNKDKTFNCEFEGWKAGWNAREETVLPVLDTLERLYDSGHYVKKQDDMWWLFNKDGEGVTFGATFRSMCLSIILMGL